MNKYKLRMKTLSGLGIEYVYVYATSNFERYLNIHNLKYARDITKDYQLTDRFETLQQENQQQKEVIEEIREVINKMITTGYVDGTKMYMATYERSEFGVRAKVLLQILDKYKN